MSQGDTKVKAGEYKNERELDTSRQMECSGAAFYKCVIVLQQAKLLFCFGGFFCQMILYCISVPFNNPRPLLNAEQQSVECINIT